MRATRRFRFCQIAFTVLLHSCFTHRAVKMDFFVLILLTVSICGNSVCTKTITTTEHMRIVRRPMETSTVKDIENHMKNQLLWKNLLPRQNLSKIEKLREIANTKVDDPLNRKSKILGSVAFLPALSANSLSEASSNLKTYTKFSPAASSIPPQVAAIYDPYPYMAHPYIFATPLGFYSLLNLLRLQPLDNNKSTEINDNNEYVEEAKKVENIKASSDVDDTNEGSKDNEEFEVDNDQIAGEKMVTSNSACEGAPKRREDFNGSMISQLRAQKTNEKDATAILTKKRKTNTSVSDSERTNTTNATTISPLQNTTDNYNYTDYPFHGYYGGYPQNINHIDITTTNYKYHDFEHVNYNLPPYEKPANFYSDDRYNYYSAPPVDSYSSNQFHQEQVPEYFSNDFKRYLYTSDDTPNSDFRPVL